MSAAYDYEDETAEGQEPEAPKLDLRSLLQMPNIAEEVPGEVLARLGAKVCEEFKIDEDSRIKEGWTQRHDASLKLAMQVKEAKTYPWPNAANVKYPLITVAAMQFAARAYPAIVDGANVVKGKVLGKPTEEKRDRADRIGKHMSFQLLEEMPEWEEGTDQLLHILPCTGTVFRKTYFDPAKGRNCSELVTADKLVVNYWAKVDAPRITQVCEYYPAEIEGKFRSGVWLRQDLGRPMGADNDDDAPHTFLEQHRLYDLDDDGYPEPYVCTVHKETQKVVRIVARFDEDGIKANANGEIYSIEPVEYFTRYWFIPPLDGSYYGLGFGTLLDALNETINSTLNLTLDAAHLANVQGGFIGAGVSMKSGSMRFQPGEWKRVETSGQILKDALVPLPAAGPSNVLFQLLGMLIEAAKDITATKDILTGETQQANTPVGTTLAQIEQGLKVFSSIYKRVHRSLKLELGLLYRLNRLYLEPEAYFAFQDEEGVVAQADYAKEDVDVIPVSDPTVVTDMQRIGRAQYLMQFMGAPGMNAQKIIERALEAASIPDIKELFQEGPPPEDPMVALKREELKLREREVQVKETTGLADVGSKVAGAQKTMTEAVMTAPDAQADVASILDERARDIVGALNGPGQGPVDAGGVPGLGGAPAEPEVPGLPPVGAGQAGAEMAVGGGDEPPAPDQGLPPGGDQQPFLG